MNHHTNEVRRIIADFSNLLTNQEIERSAYPLGGEARLFIVGDEQPDGSIRYSLIGDGTQWGYSLISTLCDYRVIEAESADCWPADVGSPRRRTWASGETPTSSDSRWTS